MLKKIIAIISLLCLVFAMLTFDVIAAEGDTESSVSSNVLDDLKRDSSFFVSDYPVSSTNYSFEVIQIAESNNKELFVYTYNPSYQSIGMKAAEITMWDTPSLTEFTALPYNLTLVSEFEQFQKYRVEGYTVCDERVRYYNFTQIHVPYNETAHKDREIIAGTTDLVAYSVGQSWQVKYINDTVWYDVGELKVIELDYLYNGELLLKNGITFNNFFGTFESSYLHFIVFTCDEYILDDVYDADMRYKTQKVIFQNLLGSDEIEYVDEKPRQEFLYIDDKDIAYFDSKGWLAGEDVEWHRIMKSDAFKKSMTDQGLDLADDLISKLDVKNSWVFAFTETERTLNYLYDYSVSGTPIMIGYQEYKTLVTEVSVLRLHFFDKTKGEFNLGTVMDITTSDGIPDGSNKTGLDIDDFWEKFKEAIRNVMTIIGIVLIVVLIGFCMPILSPIISLVVNLIGFILKTIISIITFPFKLIFRRKRN